MLVGPIIVRELLTTPRRPRHYILRSTYIGLFFVLMWTAWQAIIGFQKAQRLGDIAYFNVILFQLFAYTQLGLLLFAASLYGASSISHEKDRQTFILLLITRLGDAEIVVNKFLCGLLQVSAVMLAAAPVFLISLLMGGVGFDQVAQVYAVTFGAVLVSNAAGVLIATWREKTFQAVSMTILAVVFSLIVVEMLAAIGGTVTIGEQTYSMTDLATVLSPFRAIAAITGTGGDLVVPIFRTPSLAYLAVSSLSAALFLGIASYKLRAWNPRGEPIQQREAPSDSAGTATSGKDRDQKRRARRLWANPVLWREIMSRAYGTRPILIKVGYFVIFALMCWGLWSAHPSPTDPGLYRIVARTLLPLAVISLLLVNTQAVAAVTSERDLKSLDLLLVTDLTPKEFIYGKLWGIFYNTKEMILAPLALLAACWAAGWVSGSGTIYTTITFLVFVIFAAVLGIHAALRYDSTRVAIANSLGTMFLLFVGILICLFLIVISGRFEAQWASFILFIVLGSIGMWVSLSANAPSNAIGLTAFMAPMATFYCVIAFLMGDRAAPFLVGTGVYGFAVLALLIPLLSEFDVATGRTTAEEG